MHLEASRFAFFAAVEWFLLGRSGAAEQTPAGAMPGYTYGTAAVDRSPMTLDELAALERTVRLNQEDQRYLRMAGDVLEDQVDAILELWRGIIAAEPHLSHYFVGPDGRPDERYKAAVRRRLAQWILDTCRRPHDQAWLDYQDEIGRRHTHARKNATDGASTPPHIPLRYVLAFTAVVNTTIRPFLARKGHCAEEIEAMHRAWIKAVTLEVTLWSRAYTDAAVW